MGEIIGLLMVLFIIDMVFGNRKTHRAWRYFFKMLGRFIKNVICFDMYIIKHLYYGIKTIYWVVRFKGFKTVEQVKKEINHMEPRSFEIFCSDLYKQLGYKAKLTPFGNDYGRDIIIEDNNGEKTYIECKRWSINNGDMVGREICQKLIGSCASFNVTKGIIINTGNYHENAYEYANRINKTGNFYLELLGTEDLLKMYKKSIEIKRQKEMVRT